MAESDAHAWLGELLTALDVPAEAQPAGGWVVNVPSETRETLPVLLIARERSIVLRAFVIRAPDRNPEAVYRRALRKNLDTSAWRFAVDDLGDVFLSCDVPRKDCDAERLDGLLGLAARYVDEVFEGLARTGFTMPDDWSPRRRPPA